MKVISSLAMMLTNPFHVCIVNTVVKAELIEPNVRSEHVIKAEYAATFVQLMACSESHNLVYVLSSLFCISLVSVMLAALTPRLDLLISLSGALTTSLICLVIPAILDIVVNCNAPRWVQAKNWCLIVLGMATWIVGTVVSGRDLLKSIK